MPNTLRHKRSSTASAVPAAGSLVAGELAVNTADGRVYLKRDDNAVIDVGATRAHTHATTDIVGLGTIATQNANSVAITGGSINGTTIGATTPSTSVFTSIAVSGAGDRGVVRSVDNASLALIGGQQWGGATPPGAIFLRGGTSSFNVGGMEFYTGATERMRIDNIGNSLFGSTSVVGARYFDIANTDATVNSAVVQRLITRNAANTANTTVDFVKYNSGPFYIVNNEGAMYFGTGGVSERIALLANGNVGIGTASPGQRLHVQGGEIWCTNSNFALGSTGSIVGFSLGASTGNTYGAISATHTGGGAWSNLVLQVGGGNVGIGTTNPTRALHVVASDFFAARISSTSTVATVLEVHNAAATWELGVNGSTGTTGAAGTFYLWQTGVGARMAVTSTGNVGIGTASPAVPLDVAAVAAHCARFQTHALSSDAFISVEEGQGGERAILGSFSGVPFVGTDQSRSFEIRTSNAARLAIDASGNFSSVIPGGSTLLPAFSCRAWVNFNGQAASNLSGTYSQSGLTVTVTATGHGLGVGSPVALTNFPSTGGSVTATVTVVSVPSANSFTYTATGSPTTGTGTVSILRSTIRASGNVSSVSDHGVGNYTINFSTPMPDANYSLLVTVGNNDNGQAVVSSARTGTVANSHARISTNFMSGSVGTLFDFFSVNVAVFR